MTGKLDAQTFGQVEYGDFQTPPALAAKVVATVARQGRTPRAVVEPTCGLGNILAAAVKGLPHLEQAVGLDINPRYVRAAVARDWRGLTPRIRQVDFFALDLDALTAELPEPYLFIGNPPWVTNAVVGLVGGANLPRKENFQGLVGLDALTGKSNFDVSEWILLRLLENVAGTPNGCAMLVKTAVARKIVAHAHRRKLWVRDLELRAVDAKEHFGASVSACLFSFWGAPDAEKADYTYRAFPDLDASEGTAYAYLEGHFVSDPEGFARTQGYSTTGQRLWRSGVKHDLASVMELRRVGAGLVNGAGVAVDIEPDLVYPLLKSSDVAKGEVEPRLYTIVTQRAIAEPTENIAHAQPRTWAYLKRYEALFNKRKSSIYRGKPPFSIFGVGAYSFAPYKIAISGLYKRLHFTLLEPVNGKCVMVDDTCYFVGFDDRLSAHLYLAALRTDEARAHFSARITWDDKRPIKKDVLDSFDLPRFVRDHAARLAATAQSEGFSMEEVAAQIRPEAPEPQVLPSASPTR